jgi:hypothetical protein
LYKASGIEIEDQTRINAIEFLRLLDALHHDKLVATENEIRGRIPSDIPKIIELHDRFHPDVINGELPSRNETFIQISKVLETKMEKLLTRFIELKFLKHLQIKPSASASPKQ